MFIGVMKVYFWESPEEVRQEVKARGGTIIKIKFASEISDGMLWNV